MAIASIPLLRRPSSTAAPLIKEISRSDERPPMTTATRPYSCGDNNSDILQTLFSQVLRQQTNVAGTLRYQNVAIAQEGAEDAAQLLRLLHQHRVKTPTLTDAAREILAV